MNREQTVLLIGASVRAAAGSALRAGLRPWCVDLFADADLQAACPARRLPGKYPHGFIAAAAAAPAAPWLYTGGLENWPELIGRLARQRLLWGNGPDVLRAVRRPENIARVLDERRLPCPAIHAANAMTRPGGRWLRKPRRGAGGRYVAAWKGDAADPKRWYVQEYVEGESCAAVFVGDGRRALFFGATRQLVGEAWLHARRFQYCGSIGPLPCSAELQRALARLGDALAEGFALRGLFGVDCIIQRDVPWPVEVNPRYPASVEVLEYATGIDALPLHAAVSERGTWSDQIEPAKLRMVIGKAVLFARDGLTFPSEGPWQRSLQPPREMPSFADIPHAGARIEVGQPIMTLFAQAESVASCLACLKDRAAEVEQFLFLAKA